MLKIRIKPWALIALFVLWTLSLQSWAAPAKVLVIYSWHDQLPWQAGVRAGIAEHLNKLPLAERPVLFEERIDAARIEDATSHAALARYLCAKYANTRLDTIISESQSAHDFLTKHTDCFADTPRYVVSVDIPGQSASLASGYVFAMEQDLGQALQTILRVMPDRDRILVIVNDSVSDFDTSREQMDALAVSLSPRVPLEFYTDFSFAELYAKVHDLSPRSAVLYLPILQDRLGVRQIPYVLAERLAAISRAPIFVHHDSFFGTGVVGGYVLSAPRVGELIARIARGLPLPRSTQELDAIVKTYQFDHYALRRWGIPDERLPSPHVIVGRAPSVWDTYRWELASIVAVVVFQTALIVQLLRSMRERRKVLDELGQERALLERRVEERTSALSRSESFLRTIIDNEPEGIQIVDEDGLLAQINAAGLAILETDDPASVVGTPFLRFLAPDYRDAFQDLHRRVLAGAKRQMQCEMIGLRGTSRWVETHAVPMHSDGRTMNLALIRDIDDRKKAEMALQRYRENLENHVRMLRNITAQLPGMVYQFLLRPDGSTCFPYASEGIAGICGLSPEDVREDATPAFARVYPDDLPAVWNSAHTSASTGQPWRMRFRVVDNDGTLRWIHGNGMPRIEPDGSCLWHGFMSDATAEIEAQNNLRLAASVFANAQEGITITDASCRILDINPAFSRITGYLREEVLGKTPRLLSSGHHDAQFYRRMWQILHDQGTWRGEIWNRSKRGEVYPELLSIAVVKDNAGKISHYIGSFSDITGIKEREAKLNRLAHYDPLTDLPNRRLFTDRLRQGILQTQRTGKIMAVCVLDIDHLQTVNDTHGLRAGDEVLAEVSRRMRSSLRQHDIAARLGGDAFALMLLDLEWVEECDAILRRILFDIALPFVLPLQSAGSSASGNATVGATVSATVGATMFPQDGQDPETLLRRADTALRHAKKMGGGGYRLYNPEHDRLVRDHRRLIEDLTKAISHDQFILYYQPCVEIATGRVTNVEAMIRWRHPERGLLMPAEFLYALTDTELESQLGIWVLHNALGQIAQWKRNGLHLPVSINLSARDICHDRFPDELAKALSQHPSVAGAELEIEVPESQALEHTEEMAQVIAACHDLGVRIALDGFGMGNSPLSYFRTLPVDVLKIDPDYVRDIHEDPEDLATVDGIVKIARAFRRDVVAVGVEHQEQQQILLQLGCRYGQGYAYAMPMPAGSLVQWVGQR